jgi:hypothetical protein
MRPFIVLVTRHKWEDTFTTQLTEYVESRTRITARALVRAMYPQEYVKFYENGVLIGDKVAHFTGAIYGA